MFGFSVPTVIILVVIIGIVFFLKKAISLNQKRGLNRNSIKPNSNEKQKLLISLLFNKLSHIEPEFIGKFNDINDLPKKEYPPVYYWIKKSLKDSPIVISHNKPLLQEICYKEIMENNLRNSITPNDVESAVNQYIEISTKSLGYTIHNLLKEAIQFSKDDTKFKYDSGIVSRVKLEKAIDVFVKIEEEFQKKQKLSIKLGQTMPDYEEIAAKYSNETDAAERAIRQFGKQIKPNKLKNMQKEFYDIINNESGIKRDIAYSLLNSKWDGIGEWCR